MAQRLRDLAAFRGPQFSSQRLPDNLQPSVTPLPGSLPSSDICEHQAGTQVVHIYTCSQSIYKTKKEDLKSNNRES